MLKSIFLALLWLAAFLAITLLGSPLMLVSGIPFLTMLAFVAPCLWVLASVMLYIAWAELGWREEWEESAPKHECAVSTLCPKYRIAALFAVIALSGCDLRAPRQTESGTQNLLRFHDDQMAVTCWQVKNWDGIYCIRDQDLAGKTEGAARPSGKQREPRSTREIIERATREVERAADAQGAMRITRNDQAKGQA